MQNKYKEVQLFTINRIMEVFYVNHFNLVNMYEVTNGLIL